MPISATIDERNGTTLQNQNAHYVVVASILSYTQLRTQRVELISKCPRFLWCIYSAKCEMLRGQNETEVIIEADVNFFTYLKSQTCSLSCFYWNRVESDNFQALVQHPNIWKDELEFWPKKLWTLKIPISYFLFLPNIYHISLLTDVWSRDFIIWKINFWLWAVVWAGLWNKRVWAVYEQLFRPVF